MRVCDWLGIENMCHFCLTSCRHSHKESFEITHLIIATNKFIFVSFVFLYVSYCTY